MRKGFTLAQLLIGVAVLAVLAVVVIMTINPANLSKQARDTTRLSDINTINKAVDMARTDLLPLGTANTVYVSIPDTSPTCANLGLATTLPSGWSYACVTAANLRKTDGTGWVPVNFTAASVGSPISKLPVDPVNSTSSNNYYTYMASGTVWTITVQSVESAKQLIAHPSGLALGNGPTITVPYAMTTYTGTGVSSFGEGAFDGTNMWMVNHDNNSVTKISPTGTMTTYTGTWQWPGAIAFDGINMWTANGTGVTKISPTGTMATYPGTGNGDSGLAFDGINMWTVGYFSQDATKISPTGTMTTYPGIWPNGGLAFDGTNMWTRSGSNSVTKISPTGATTTYTGTGDLPYGIAFDGTNMWTANYGDNSVTKISPTGTMTTYTGTGKWPMHIAFDGTNMWTSNGDNSVTKIATR